MWLLLLYLQILTIQGQDRVVLRGSDSPCKGRLEVYRKQERQWGLVCPYGWNDRNGKVVCKSLGCGDLMHSDKEMSHYKDPPLPEQYFMDQVNCSSEEENLRSCPHVGRNTIDCKEIGFVAVECSGNVELSLNMNGQRDKCAGVVQFKIHKDVIGVCNSKWDTAKANTICQELKCGQHAYIPKPGMFEVENTKKGLLNCIGNEKFSWQCMEWPQNCWEDASVICSNPRRFRLTNGSNLCSGLVEELKEKLWVGLNQTSIDPETICTQLNCGSRVNFTDVKETNSTHLTCSGNVSLRNLPACFGSVNVNINGSAHGVCYSDFRSHELGTVVCRELGCGEVLDVKQGNRITNGWLSNIECGGDEESLWHCLAKHKKTECYVTTVICADSLKVRLSDGWSHCSGRVQVNLEGSWRYVNGKDWTNVNSNVVCKHLGCGSLFQMTQELFIEVNPQGNMDWEVKCKSSSVKFHECFKKTTKEPKQIPFVTKQIICQKEEFKFIKGDQPCQGEICIESFDGKKRSLDLKSLNKTTVCSEMNCGALQLSDPNTTHVNCSGSVHVSLSERCWGEVKIDMMVGKNECRDDGCGGICKKTWRLEDSEMLCADLSCGNPINKFQLPLQTQKHLQVKHYSVYCPKQVKNLRMCKFTPNKDICKDPASVVCSGSVKSRLFSPLMTPREKCAGNVELFYAGIWTPVCKDSLLDPNLQNTICRELNCVRAESVADAQYEESQTKGLTGIKCSNKDNSLLECKHDDVSTKNCIAGYLKCSGWRRLLLYKKDGVCSGPVYALSEHSTPQHVSVEGWTKQEGQLMCEYLQCGNYISHTGQNPGSPTSEWWNKTYSCIGNETNIWDCERDSQSDKPQQLNIKCDGKPLVLRLSGSCTGEVLINNENVCASEWTEKMSDDVCDNLKCGRAIHYWQRPISVQSEGWHFSCSGRETFLQQCSHKRGKCANIISVACQKSVQFSTTKKCGGFLGVKYQDQWEYVCGDLKKPDVDAVCKVLDCQKNLKPLIEREKMANKKQVTIKCPERYQYLSQCVNRLQEDKCKSAVITCEGFDESTPVNSGLIVGLLLGFLALLVLIGITQRKRLLSALRHYRSKDVKDMNLNGQEMNNIESVDGDSTERKMQLFDQDDYQDVDIDITNTERENDVDETSARSSGTEYDDIEEQANDASHPQTHADEDQTLPLLPKRPDNLHDEVTYEVEIQEDYDDVMSGEAPANENAEILMKVAPAQGDVILDAGANTNTNEVEVEVHNQPE